MEQKPDKKDEDSGTVLYQCKANSKYRIKSLIGQNVINLGYGTAMLLLMYLCYHILYKRNMNVLFFYIVIQGYTSFFAKKWDFILKYYEKFEVCKWYNSFKIITEEPLKDKKTLYCVMPHNILSIPLLNQKGLKESPFKDTVLLSTRLAVESPIVGTIAKWGGIETVNATNFEKLMTQGKNMAFVPGGFEEATLTSHKEYRIYADRRGFIKYALRHGYDVRVVFNFNENQGYKTWDWGMKYRLWFNKIKAPGALFFSKFGIIPESNIDVRMVIGKSLNFPKIENPTKEDISKFYEEYIQYIRELFDKHSKNYDPNGKLVFHSNDQKIKQM